MKLSPSVKIALLITAAFVLYFGVMTLTRGNAEKNLASDEASNEDALFTVVATPLEAEEWRDRIIVRGRTQADRKVVVRAETPGVVAETPIEAGSLVQKGQVLCRLKVDARRAALTEARAAYRRAELDHDAAVKLTAEGFRSETSLAAFKAALDLAAANVEKARVDLGRTEVTAPFDGIFDDRAVEQGDFLNAGQACGTVIQKSPFLVIGAISEKDVSKVAAGDKGRAHLATGETIDGVVRFIAAAADPATRTFDVELEVPNEDGVLRDGVTAEFEIFAQPRQAYLSPRSALTLDDDGRVGLRHVNAEGIVSFSPVTLMGETDEGVWISGMEGAPHIIIRGQDYVREGQQVDVISPQEAAS